MMFEMRNIFLRQQCSKMIEKVTILISLIRNKLFQYSQTKTETDLE